MASVKDGKFTPSMSDGKWSLFMPESFPVIATLFVCEQGSKKVLAAAEALLKDDTLKDGKRYHFTATKCDKNGVICLRVGKDVTGKQIRLHAANIVAMNKSRLAYDIEFGHEGKPTRFNPSAKKAATFAGFIPVTKAAKIAAAKVDKAKGIAALKGSLEPKEA